MADVTPNSVFAQNLDRLLALKRLGRKEAAEAIGVATKKCDEKVAPEDHLKVFTGDSQDEEQAATDGTPVDQPQKSAEPQTPATEPEIPQDAPPAQLDTLAPTITPHSALEYLHRINIKLEKLERGLKGVTPDDHFLNLINQAIATLQRLRGDVATDIDAA